LEPTVDLQNFRQIVDQTPARIAASEGDPARLYAYIGLSFKTSYSDKAVSDALCERIRNAFTSGHGEAWRTCRSLETDLIREHVILDAPLNPYFEVLSHLKDALRAPANEGSKIDGDWHAAIQAAQDHVKVSSYKTTEHRRIFAREFSVAEAAKFLKQQGYSIRLEPGFIALEEIVEKSLVVRMEELIDRLGGLNVARKIFAEISPVYDVDLQRYHLVPHISPLGGGQPQRPWGYLLQLAVKHIDGQKPYFDLDKHWQYLLDLVTAYAAVIDVQPYAPLVYMNFDAKQLLKFLQEQALYDSIFRFSQLRTSDILKLCRGALGFLDFEKQTSGGWTLNEAFEVISYLIDPVRDVRGPATVAEKDVRRGLPHINKDVVAILLGDVLAHRTEGPNQGFSRPTDGPTPDDKSKGADFYLKPLIRRPGNRYLIVDRSICGWGYLEALLTALRLSDKQFDDKVGTAIENFLKNELSSRHVPTISGDYDLDGEHGQCDLVAATPQTLIFMELKKKSLTRRARTGVDADLLLDLAGSLLAAQAQAGWHELRIKNAGELDLTFNGIQQHLSLDGRGTEKIAVGMQDFGSFQDRIMLEKFMVATLNVNFGSPDPAYAKRFKAINDALQEIRDQYAATHQGKTEVRQPFFNCWFVSIPQVLVMLDEVTDADTFREALWKCRHMTTGTSDLYFEISNRRRLNRVAG
jgi:hypothetical protein